MTSHPIANPEKRGRGRPPVPKDKQRVKKYVGLAPADLEKFEALQAADKDWLTKQVRSAKLPQK